MAGVRTPATAGIQQGALPGVLITGAGLGGATLPQTTPGSATPTQVKPVNVHRDKVYARRTPISGRLISLTHAGEGIHSFLLGAQSVTNAVVINFPSMPDVIELVRQAEYRVTSNFVIPDGIHQYKGTHPLEIPFTFKLHAFDDAEYCEHGALTLLQIAGRLHALTLPINRAGAEIVATAAGELASLTDTSDAGSEKRAVDTTPRINTVQNPPLFPVACKLDLIYTGENSPGISCTGYVKDVNVKLYGPFMRTSTIRSNNPQINNTNYKGLPTSAEYSFRFVHRPGHTNRFNSTQQAGNFDLGVQINAYADDVKNNFYNTVGLLSNKKLAYEGFTT